MKQVNTDEVKKSYRGVYFNIEDSNICSLKYGLYFYFCSKAMKIKFDNTLDSFIEKTKKRINFIIPLVGIENIDLALAIYYYSAFIEKRGYRIETLHGARIKKAHLIGDVEFLDNEEE